MTEPVKMTHAERVTAILDQWNETDGPTVHDTTKGRVQIDSIEPHENSNTIMVKVHGSDEEIIIVNPPCHRPDPNGEVDVELNTKFTFDPVGTVAEVIGMHIGVG